MHTAQCKIHKHTIPTIHNTQKHNAQKQNTQNTQYPNKQYTIAIRNATYKIHTTHSAVHNPQCTINSPIHITHYTIQNTQIEIRNTL